MSDAKRPQKQDSSKQISLFGHDQLEITGQLEATVDQSIEKRLKKYFVWLLTSVILVVIGALIATIWQLNSAIYQAVGKQSESGLFVEVLKLKIESLEKENALLKSANACLRKYPNGKECGNEH